MTKETIIGVIPARYASQRLPAKPLIDLLGKTMIQRVYEQAKRATLLSKVMVATDDRRIEEAVKGFGGEVMMTSPDIRSGSDRVAAVAEAITGDIYVNIQGDEPLIAPKMIDEAVRVVLDDKEAVVGSLARKITEARDLVNPGVVKVVMDRSGVALYFSRSTIPRVRDEKDPSRWMSHTTFYKHIGIYVFRRDVLRAYSKLSESPLEQAEKLEQLRILESGYRIRMGVTTFDSIPVDTMEDAERIRDLLHKEIPTS